ncbi:hypothetical protein MTsN3n11_10180 [Qipengyuania sp. MTN3-11]
MKDRRLKRLFAVASAMGLLGAVPMPAGAEELPAASKLNEAELRSARAGFTIQGLEISLGADLRTYLDGELVLHTVVNWIGDQATSSRWVANTLTPADSAALGGVLANGHITMRLGDEALYLANGGQTALLQRSDGGLQNLIFNTASGVDLRQEADISISVSDLQGFQTAIAPGVLVSGLSEAMGGAAITANGF